MKTVTFAHSPFVLHEPFPPAGDQPQAIEKLVEGLEAGVMFHNSESNASLPATPQSSDARCAQQRTKSAE